MSGRPFLRRERPRPIIDDIPVSELDHDMTPKKKIDMEDIRDDPRYQRRLHPSENLPGTRHNAYGLTQRQERFVREYLTNGGNKTRAYRMAYTTAGWSEPSIGTEAQRVFKNPLVSQRIMEAQAAVAERSIVTVAKIERELALLAFGRLASVATWGKDGVAFIDSDTLDPDDAAAVLEVGETVTKYGTKQRIRMHDKKGPLELLARIKGMLDADKGADTEIAITGGMPGDDRV